MKRRLLTIVCVAVAVALLFGLAWAGGFFQLRIPASGNVRSVGLVVYKDQECTVLLENIPWGFLSPDANKTVVCYLNSTSNVDASLSLAYGNWVPSVAANYIWISWDREGMILAPNEIIPAALVLHVDPAIENVTSFSVDIVISATAEEG